MESLTVTPMSIAPYHFAPQLKTTIWGGDRIASFKGLATDQHHVGESWEISAVPGSESVVSDGGLADGSDVGLTLSQLIERHRGLLIGQHVYARHGSQFPLLVKFIDAHDNLSLQVHPNDQQAMERHGCMGKTEMWYVIDSEEGATIYSGMARKIDADECSRRAHEAKVTGKNPFEDVVACHDAIPGDIFFLPAGRIHAIGAGTLVAEIQQTSDITYRLFDFGRLDSNGQPRQLHIEEAKDVIDYTVHPTYKSYYDNDAPVAELVTCAYFRVLRVKYEEQAEINYRCDSFIVVMCMDGEGCVNGVPFHQGETLLVPACDNVMHLTGNATLVTAFV
ncbi:MAG: class I mannose-6-phosphate isomerase [Bacteroidaceae bacterium]|nr:class I mannose-6-phosphate isomerase [Bacteroidaceae bacterium]